MAGVVKVAIVLPGFELKVRVPRLPSVQSFSSTRHRLPWPLPLEEPANP